MSENFFEEMYFYKHNCSKFGIFVRYRMTGLFQSFISDFVEEYGFYENNSSKTTGPTTKIIVHDEYENRTFKI